MFNVRTTLRLATLAFALFRVSQSPRRKNTKRVHLYLFLFRPAHELRVLDLSQGCWHGGVPVVITLSIRSGYLCAESLSLVSSCRFASQQFNADLSALLQARPLDPTKCPEMLHSHRLLLANPNDLTGLD